MKYKNYYNYETGNRNIYSRSNLLNMTVQDLFDNELPIAYQFNTIGIPDDNELEMSPNTHKFVDEKGITRWGVNDGMSPIQHGLGGTTEEMLARERLQNQQAEMNPQMSLPTETVRPSVSGIQDDIAPVPEIAPTPINISMDKFGKVVDKVKGKFKKKQEPSGPIADAIQNEVEGKEPPANPIEDAIDTAVNPESQEKKGGFASKISEAADSLINKIKPGKKYENMDLEQPFDKYLEQGATSDSESLLDKYLKQSGETEDVDLENPFDKYLSQDNEPEQTEPTTPLRGDPMWKEMEQALAGQKKSAKKKRAPKPLTYDPSAPFEVSVEKSSFKDRFQNFMHEHSQLLKDKFNNFQDTGFNKNDDLDLKGEVKDYLRKHSKVYRNYEGLTPMEAGQKWASKFLSPLTAREYYGLASELKDDGKPAKKRLRDNDFYKLSDIHNEETRKLIEKNMIQNLELDPNNPATYEKIKDIDIVVPKGSSNLYKLVKNSDELAKFVAGNYDNLKSNPGQRLDSSIEYPRPNRNNDKGQEFWDKANRYAIYKKSDISAKMNPDGSMTIWHPDFYDFDYMDLKEEPDFVNKKIARANNRALSQQEKGQLKKYSLASILTLSPEDIEELLERERKRKNNK